MHSLDVRAFLDNDGRLLDARSRAFAFQQEIERVVPPAKRLDLPLRHFFADGVYVREMFMPKWTAIVGHIHKYEHVAIVHYGDMSVYDHTGLRRIVGPRTFVSEAGVKRAFYLHEDTLFSTVHRLRDPNMRDLNELEKEFVAATDVEYKAFLADHQRGLLE